MPARAPRPRRAGDWLGPGGRPMLSPSAGPAGATPRRCSSTPGAAGCPGRARGRSCARYGDRVGLGDRLTPARAAPLLRHPHARPRRRHPRRAGAARPRLDLDHAGVHAGVDRAALVGLRGAPTRGRVTALSPCRPRPFDHGRRATDDAARMHLEALDAGGRAPPRRDSCGDARRARRRRPSRAVRRELRRLRARWPPSRARTGRWPASLRSSSTTSSGPSASSTTARTARARSAASRSPSPARGHAGDPVLHRPRVTGLPRWPRSAISSGGSSGRCGPAGPRRPTRRGPSQLLPGEVELWRRDEPAPTGATRSASPGGSSARSAHEATRPVLAAALLHDVGKIECGLGTYGRVIATLSAAWSSAATGARRGPAPAASPARSACTCSTPSSAATCSAMAGSDPLTVAWAREHHLPSRPWTVEPAPGRGPQGRRRRLSGSRRSSSAQAAAMARNGSSGTRNRARDSAPDPTRSW